MSHSKTSCDPQQLLVDWDALESRGALLEPFEHRCGIDDQRVDLFIRRWGMVFQIKFRTFIRGIRIYLACFHSFGGQAKGDHHGLGPGTSLVGPCRMVGRPERRREEFHRLCLPR